MGRLKNSWDTVKASWRVLKQDKELLLFPVFSGLASLIVMASFVAPTWFSGLFEKAFEQEDQNAQTIVFAIYFVMYLVLAFITFYFTAAVVSAATERLSGGDPTVGSGLRGANKRLGKILAWSLFAGTVSFLIKMLESATRRGGRGALVGNILTRLVGVAWTLATFFAVPVILYENLGVFASLKRSGQLFKQRWGESLVGQYGIGFVFGIFTFLVILAAAGLVMVSAAAGPIAVITVLVLAVVALLILSIVGTALGAVYKAALYRYATVGQVAPEYPAQLIQDAYRPA